MVTKWRNVRTNLRMKYLWLTWLLSRKLNLKRLISKHLKALLSVWILTKRIVNWWATLTNSYQKLILMRFLVSLMKLTERRCCRISRTKVPSSPQMKTTITTRLCKHNLLKLFIENIWSKHYKLCSTWILWRHSQMMRFQTDELIFLRAQRETYCYLI